MFMIAMFDLDDQLRLAEKLSLESRYAIRDRMLDGGSELQYIMF